MDLSRHSVEDLVTDPSFRAWAGRTDQAAIALWESWIADQPEILPIVEEARQWVLRLQFAPAPPSLAEMEEVKRNIDRWIEREKPMSDTEKTMIVPGSRRAPSIRALYKWTVAAACVTVVAGAFLLWQQSRPLSVSTGFGMTRALLLPDGSRVVLNANSTLRYGKNWKENANREVWIEGEGFFSVTHGPAEKGAKFIVHAKGMDVAVLGTAFNVYSRRGNAAVVLESGKVLASGTGAMSQAGSVGMRPGQRIVLDSAVFRLSSVNPTEFTAWKEGRLAFTNRPLVDIARVLEDNYGFRVIWKQERLRNLYFTGSCPAGNIRLLLSAIQEVYGVKIIQQGQDLIFE